MGLADGFTLFITILEIASLQCIWQSVSFLPDALTDAGIVRKIIIALM